MSLNASGTTPPAVAVTGTIGTMGPTTAAVAGTTSTMGPTAAVIGTMGPTAAAAVVGTTTGTTSTTPPAYIPVSMYMVTPNPNVADTAGLMRTLSNYLVNSPLMNKNIGDYNNVGDQINDINDSLQRISASLDGQSTEQILSNQNNVQSIVDTEMNRLTSKQQSIDSAVTTQKRMLMMNESYMKRQQVYTRIAVAVVIALVVLIVCKVVSASMADANLDSLLTIISILVIVAVVIYCAWAMVNLWRRDPIYYDQLHYIPDNQPVPPLVQGADIFRVGQTVSNNPVYDGLSCVGASCCKSQPGISWDASLNACIVTSNTPSVTASATPSTTATLGVAKKEGFGGARARTQNGFVAPYYVDEFVDYQQLPGR